MSSAPLRHVVRQLLRGLPPADGTDDAALLERFIAWRDEAAFELLVYRHGPLVRGVCRRVLRHEQDAEDAFQATFLALARKAEAVRRARSLPGWLYRVAFHAALKARARSARRNTVPVPAEVACSTDPSDDVLTREVRGVLDEEVMRLPERLRLPVVLCYLQGKSNAEAAAALGCPKGTVDSRLAGARQRLRSRLLRRGLAPAAGAALEQVLVGAGEAAELSAAVVRPAVLAVVAFVDNQLAAVPAVAAALAHEVLHTMFLNKVKWTAVVLVTLGLLGSGAGVATYEAMAGGQPQGAPQAKAPPAKAPEAKAPEPTFYLGTFTLTGSPSSAAEVRKLLTQPAGLDKPLENMSLREALDLLSDKFHVTIRIDPVAFRSFAVEEPFKIYDQQVRLPIVRGMTVGQILHDLLGQMRYEVPQVTFVVKGSQIVIVPAYIIPFARTLAQDAEYQPILNPDVVEQQVQGEPVTVDYQNKPLAEALRELADATGTNIVLDSRVKDQGQTPVTVSLQNVRLFTALRVLADMADLQPTTLGNVYYVTTKANAERLFKQEWLKPAPGAVATEPAKPAPPKKPAGP